MAEQFNEKLQQEFITTKLEEFARAVYDALSRQARSRSEHVPRETLQLLSYQVIKNNANLAADYVLRLQDSGRIVDMRRIDFKSRPITQQENFIRTWAMKKGISTFRKIPGYSRKKDAKNLTDEQKLERIAAAIIAAKGSQNKRKRRRKKKTWDYNKTLYQQIGILITKLRTDQAAFLQDAIKSDLEEVGNLNLGNL